MVPYLRKNVLLNSNFVITCSFFFICAFITEKRANVVYPKFFDAFVSDWLKFLINIHDEIVALATNQAGRVRVKVSQVVKLFGALEATRKTPVRRTAKEKVAPQLQPKVRVVS